MDKKYETQRSVYKVRNTVTGRYSSGGTRPRWVSGGRSWAAISHCKSHLTALRESGRPWGFYDFAEIVRYDLVPSLVIQIDDLQIGG